MRLLKVSVIVIVLLLFFIPTASAEMRSINGTQYYEKLDGSMTDTPSIIAESPLGYRIDWRGMYYFTIWDGVYAYDTFNYPNGTFVSPWVFPKIEYWRTTGQKRWVEVIPINNSFEQSGNQIIRRMVMGDGSKFNITYTAYDKIKYTWDFTAGANQNYSIVLRMDSAASQDINPISKRYTPGWFDNRTFYSFGDVQEPYASNVSSWYSSGDRKFYQRIILGQQSIGKSTEIDPSMQFNGSTTPAWQNTSFDNNTMNGLTANNIVPANAADWINRPNSTNIGNNWYENPDTYPNTIESNKIKHTSSTRPTSYNYSNNLDSNYNISFQIYDDSDGNLSNTDIRPVILWYIQNASNNTLEPYFLKGYKLIIYPFYNLVKFYKNNGASETQIGSNIAVSQIYNGDTITIDTSAKKVYKNGVLWATLPADSTYTNGSVGIDSEGGTVYFDNLWIWKTTTGNATFNNTFTSGRQGSQVMFNFTNATGLFVDGYASADNSTWYSVQSNMTNATLINIPASAKAQNQYVRAVLKGNTTASPELIEVSIEDEAVSGGGAPDGAIPPDPINLAQTNSSTGFWINYTWQNGTGNITNSYNVSVNGTWTNGSANNFSNGTVSAHGWRNITTWAFNSSGNGNLSTGSVTLNTQILNNAPIQQNIGSKFVTENSWLNFSVSSTDVDGDALTYATNATKGTLSGYNFSWKPNLVDAGTYYWIFNTTDNYSAVATETITITVNNVDFIPSVPIIGTVTTSNFYINTTWTSGVGNVTNSYNSTNGTVWINGTNPYRNTTLSAHAWQNLTIYAWNSSYGNLSATALTNNTQIPNNAISISGVSTSYSITEGQTLNIDADYADVDTDSGTFSDNATQWNVNSGTGVVSWLTADGDQGTYNWNISVVDGYGSTSIANFTVTVSDSAIIEADQSQVWWIS